MKILLNGKNTPEDIIESDKLNSSKVLKFIILNKININRVKKK